ncbi:uncharacterized protein LOC126265030 [Aethina tumida]|uniref:uncharacterized protein LOC126265030 n=1 Tax=Aethina tumida TaxID=116153 RepID=UPI0021477411|nr:uncharacterized protein LOC126265030 [Aethina tumida]
MSANNSRYATSMGNSQDRCRLNSTMNSTMNSTINNINNRPIPCVCPPEMQAPKVKPPKEEIKKEKKKETIMEWFDRCVEKELKKRRESIVADQELEGVKIPKKGLPVTDEFMDRMAESRATGIEIETKMRLEPDSELSNAVDKLAMAEAMICFAGAVKAAEAAVELAPPEKAEEAAVEGAKRYQCFNCVNTSNEASAGAAKPVEIIGYIGVTKPKDL